PGADPLLRLGAERLRRPVPADGDRRRPPPVRGRRARPLPPRPARGLVLPRPAPGRRRPAVRAHVRVARPRPGDADVPPERPCPADVAVVAWLAPRRPRRRGTRCG